MDLSTRRALLVTQNNPNKSLDYIVSLKTTTPDTTTQISLRFIPDKLTVHSQCFQTYIAAVFDDNNASVEERAAMVLDDVNNELVPRWAQVIAYVNNGEGLEHNVVLEERQPQWDNPHLLARMTAI